MQQSGAGKPINTGKPVNLSAPARSVFASTAQDPNYQIHQTGFCVIPALARSSGQYQGKSNYQYKKSLSCAQKQRPSRWTSSGHRPFSSRLHRQPLRFSLRLSPCILTRLLLAQMQDSCQMTKSRLRQCPSLSQARPDLMHLETYLNRNPYTNRSPCQYLNQKLLTLSQLARSSRLHLQTPRFLSQNLASPPSCSSFYFRAASEDQRSKLKYQFPNLLQTP
ncbi:hypothetical protein V565_243630 [Rhizoctonia solani 123E]|uniref:Uncharacterized protein n=1 Tax=Rhizoctonia solani 123E TaxID=1423351 RepID=A0A074RM55_9AGAM|nr:hypothetical protein V565_243630 [Rhizoctonia solani 123E]